MSFEGARTAAAERVGARLEAALAAMGEAPVVAAMRHAVAGGKRLRGFLVIEGGRLHGAAAGGAVEAAAAVEAVHAYSLVHDDLPCMDDDDLRRGRPTVHVAWDAATAVLAGDALQTLAFQLLAGEAAHPDPAVRCRLIAALAGAAGAGGMVLGQAQDIAAEKAGRALDEAAIAALQANKTGALIGWASEAGAILAGADPAPMRRYAAALGAAFQIADDILDAEGDAGRAGKRLGKDAEAGKATFVGALGLDGARRRAGERAEEAVAALSPYGPEADTLREAARFAVTRDR